MASFEKSIDVDVPLRTVYNQWTQFEEFPRFMEGVKRVDQRTDRTLHWVAEIGGKDEEWDAVILDQVPDQRISWTNTSGAKNAGTVSFQPVGPNATRVTLRIDYEPEGLVENIGSLLGIVDRRVEGDLQRFKEFIEARGHETGGWRGEIHGQQVDRPGVSQ
jgi:uncharacterized membrane protein